MWVQSFIVSDNSFGKTDHQGFPQARSHGGIATTPYFVAPRKICFKLTLNKNFTSQTLKPDCGPGFTMQTAMHNLNRFYLNKSWWCLLCRWNIHSLRSLCLIFGWERIPFNRQCAGFQRFTNTAKPSTFTHTCCFMPGLPCSYESINADVTRTT